MDEKLNSREEYAYTSPSFNSYSSDRLAEIAVQIAAENRLGGGDEDDGDFEFSLVREDKEFSAEEFSYEGQLGPIFPVFNRDLIPRGGDQCESNLLVPLSQLFLEDRADDNPPSCSSSEVDELENIPSGTYCVWRPKASDPPTPSPSCCRKSKSTGSASKRWKFRDLLRRSNSDGAKESLVFLTPKNKEEKSPTAEIQRKLKARGCGASGSAAGTPPRSAHEALYVRNRAVNEVDRKKSYLPYRQDLVGFFINVNALGKGLPHL